MRREAAVEASAASGRWPRRQDGDAEGEVRSRRGHLRPLLPNLPRPARQRGRAWEAAITAAAAKAGANNS